MKRPRLMWADNCWAPDTYAPEPATPPGPSVTTTRSTEPRVVATIHLPRGGQRVLTAVDESIGFRR